MLDFPFLLLKKYKKSLHRTPHSRPCAANAKLKSPTQRTAGSATVPRNQKKRDYGELKLMSVN